MRESDAEPGRLTVMLWHQGSDAQEVWTREEGTLYPRKMQAKKDAF